MLIKCNFQDTECLACVIFKLNQHCFFLFVKPARLIPGHPYYSGRNKDSKSNKW